MSMFSVSGGEFQFVFRSHSAVDWHHWMCKHNVISKAAQSAIRLTVVYT